MAHWISLYWAWLLPALAALALLLRLRDFHQARQRGLLGPAGWRWMLLAVVAALAVIGQTHLALTYSTAIELPLGGLVALGVLAAALRAARAAVHPGLHGFQRPIPRDGLELIEREQHGHRFASMRRLGPLLPAWGLLFIIAAAVPARRLDFALLGLTLTAPLWLIPYKRFWLTPALLAPPLLILLGQALALRPTLPAGRWATPLTGAHCTAAVSVRAGQAWCLDAVSGAVYQFHLNSGVVTHEAHVPEGARLFAASATQAWVQQVPARGLVRVSAGALDHVPVLSAHSGAAEEAGRLWVIDVGMDLSVEAAGQLRRLGSADGLLNNTANVVKVSPQGEVWVGSIGGVSVLRAGRWHTFGPESGVPGSVINIAFAPAGEVWLMWQARPGYSPPASWGVSALTAAGVQRPLELGALTGLEAPRTNDALAVDGQGRLWFVTQSILKREKYLGVATPEARVEVYPLGQFATSGRYQYGGNGLWQNSFGVVADGAGGILLYNGDSQPWRHWQP
jgi:sugar lactone lactonase YvrE